VRSWEAYLQKLRHDPAELENFSRSIHVTISRFFRNAPVFQCIKDVVLPEIVENLRAERPTRIWSAGCANGEEPYSVAIIWELHFQDRGDLVVDAQDLNAECIRRAAERRYSRGSVREVPRDYLKRFFSQKGDQWVLSERMARWVRFFCGFLEEPPSSEPYDMILCRNTIFTYGARETRIRVLEQFRSSLVDGGNLVIGRKEALPSRAGWEESAPGLGIYSKIVR
jgi:chemotaxis protein methyltransferase CheR